jgi:hypothetical protein
MLRDFHLGRFLKVALVAALTEGLGGAGFNSGGSMRRGTHAHGLPIITPEQLHLLLITAVIGAIVIVPFALLMMYLSARFTFVTFDMVLMQRPFVRPGWEALRRQGNRYFGLRIILALFGFAVLLTSIFVLLPGIQIAYHGGGWSRLLSSVMMLAPFFLICLLALLLFQCFLLTVVVPRMALEDATITDSLLDGWHELQPKIGSFLVYFLLRGAISLAIVFFSMLAVLLGIAIIGLLLAGVVFALYHFLWASSIMGKVAVIAIGVVFAIALFFAYIAAVIGVAGFRNIFREAYALLYYGGQYPPLGALLEAPFPAPMSGPVTPPFAPPPDFPPPEAIW